jgi:hypothetical protein
MKFSFSTVLLGTFILVGLVMWPQLEGMPISSQLSQIASATMLHLQELAQPVLHFLQRNM